MGRSKLIDGITEVFQIYLNSLQVFSFFFNKSFHDTIVQSWLCIIELHSSDMVVNMKKFAVRWDELSQIRVFPLTTPLSD